MADEIDRASRLPLNDAAYLLWSRKRILDRAENFPPERPEPVAGPIDPETVRRVVRKAISDVRSERDNAHDGPTFDRLKKAHPNAADSDLRRAIKLAVKLDRDSVRNFSYNVPGNPVDRAVAIAREENPDFLESTYKALWYDLSWAMR